VTESLKNTLAYYNTELITIVKKFYDADPKCQFNKTLFLRHR
jgi:hypothetical protein